MPSIEGGKGGKGEGYRMSNLLQLFKPKERFFPQVSITRGDSLRCHDSSQVVRRKASSKPGQLHHHREDKRRRGYARTSPLTSMIEEDHRYLPIHDNFMHTSKHFAILLHHQYGVAQSHRQKSYILKFIQSNCSPPTSISNQSPGGCL